MKPNRSNPLFARFFGASLTSLIVLSGVASAADVIKANNPLDLNQTSSWVGGVLPSATDVAVWDSTVTGAMNPGLGADASWLGLKILNPTGLVSVGTGGSVLNLGASGIDLSNATQSLILSPGTLNLTASQTWNVPSGRDIRLNGAGVGAGSSNVDGSGVITVQGGGLVDANQGTLAGAGFAGFSGKWIIGSGITLRGTGAGALAWGTSTAADTITLNGGTLAVGGISGTDAGYSWPQPITLGAATTSTISGQNTAVAATARELTLTGAITGSGNLNFSKTQTGGQVFAVANLGNTAGVRTNVLGTGNITVTGVTLQPRAGGTPNVITHNNNIKLVGATLISDDALQTFAGTISLEGANIVQARWGDKPATISGNIVDGGVSGGITYSGNTINVSGTNTYTGVTNISSGTVNISGTQTATSTENITGGIVNITGTQTTPGPVNITGGTVVVTSAKGLGNGLVTLDGAGVTVNAPTAGGVSTVNSLRARNDVQLGNGVLFDVTSGSVLQRTTNGFWIKGTGTAGRLTSSSGTLSLTSVDANWVQTTGNLTNIDHQIQVAITDFNGTTPLALVKNGVNHLGLAIANTYTGGTTINGGRVAAGTSTGFGTGAVNVTSGGQAWLTAATGSYANNFNISGTGPTEAVTAPATGNANYGALRFNNNTIITGNVTVGTGGARILGLGASATISGALTGTDPLEINSTDATASTATGTLTLSGNASAYAGTATVSRGALTIGSAFGGSVVKNSGTTLTVNGTVAGEHSHTTGILQGTGTFSSNLNLNGATAADVLNVVPGALHVTGNLNLSGTTTVRASGLGGTIPVLFYSGALTGNAANLSLENPTSFRPGTQFVTSTPGVINLAIVGVPITWTGSVNTDWNTTVSNWDKSGVADKYFQSDIVTFGDTGSGTINVVGAIAPRSIAINNSAAHPYTFTGAAGNSLTGNTGITKSGDGALTLNSANTFLGAVALGGGVTTISAQQAYTGGTTISSGAVLDLTGGGGATGTIRGTVNVNGGILRLSAGDVTGYNATPDHVSAVNITNGGTMEINNTTNNQTFSNVAITLTGSSIVKTAVAYNGNMDLFNGSSTITTLASSNPSIIDSGVNLGFRQPVTTITTAAGTTPDGIDLQINGTINNSPTGWTTPALVKDGPGTLVLNNDPSPIAGSTIYTGTTTINAGKLVVGTGGTSGLISAGAIIDNGSLVFNRSDDLTPANVITGTGSLTQLGGGTLTLVNGGSRSGETIAAGGRINIGTVPFTASTFRVNSGGVLGTNVTAVNSTGSVAGLVMNGGNLSLRVNTASSDKILVSGGLTVNAGSSVALIPSGNLQKDDIIPLIDYGTTITGFSNLSVAATGNPHLSFALVNNTTDTRVDAKVTAADTLIWKGNLNGGTWDETSTSNWTTTSTGSASMFYDYDKVKFTNAGTNTAVVLSGEIIPNTVEFDATINYTLSGDGITGPASLVKNNTGTATLTNFNTYTGATTINGGTLEIGDGGSLGATAITNNATFAYNQSGLSSFADVISGTGQLVKLGAGTTTISGANTFSGAVVVKAGTLIVGDVLALGTNASGVIVQSGATLNINAKILPAGETVTIAGTGDPNGEGFALTSTGDGGRLESNVILTADATVGDNTGNLVNFGIPAAPVTISGAFTLTKAGTNRLWYRAPENGVGNSLAALVVNGGTFGIESGNNGLSGVPITVNTGAILSAWGGSGAATTQNNPITLHGGVLAADYLGEIWSGPVSLTADSVISAPTSGLGFTISGVISQSAGVFGLTKNEASALTLTAINTYTGNTVVNAGSVILADNAGLKFVIGANGVNNKITGAGTATIGGDFTLDLSGAAVANGNSWTLVDTATKSFDATFTIPGFTKSGNVHTKVVGTQTWTFSEATGVLSLSVSGGSGFDSWIAGFQTLPLDQRGPSADYDADGLSNLLEYALGGSPVVSDAASIVPAGVRSGSNFVVTFKRTDLSEADTTQVLQYGNDLAGWTNVPIGASPGSGMVSISENTPTADLDTVTVTIPTTGASKFFTRLKVSKP